MANHEALLSSLQNAINTEEGSWQVGANYLLDLPKYQQDLYLGYQPGPGEPSLQEKEQVAMANFAALQSTTRSIDGLGAPASVDWRNKNGNFVTSIKNQGGCGSCVAFGTIATVESRIRILANEPNRAIDLSEAQLFYCYARAQGRNCGNGWWVGPALDAFKNSGVADDASYPYLSGDQNCSNLAADWQSRATRIQSWKSINSIPAMKEALANHGPLVGCFTVYDDFYAYRSGVYRKTANAVLRGGHCISVVGYDDVQGCWICKNSWGNVGEQGFFRIAYGQVGIDSEMWMVEDISVWINDKRISSLWAINEDRNAWVHVVGIGWKKIIAANDNTFTLMLSQLIAAKAANRPVNLLLNGGQITQIYVL